jgi:hypothetical protein
MSTVWTTILGALHGILSWLRAGRASKEAKALAQQALAEAAEANKLGRQANEIAERALTMSTTVELKLEPFIEGQNLAVLITNTGHTPARITEIGLELSDTDDLYKIGYLSGDLLDYSTRPWGGRHLPASVESDAAFKYIFVQYGRFDVSTGIRPMTIDVEILKKVETVQVKTATRTFTADADAVKAVVAKLIRG